MEAVIYCPILNDARNFKKMSLNSCSNKFVKLSLTVTPKMLRIET